MTTAQSPTKRSLTLLPLGPSGTQKVLRQSRTAWRFSRRYNPGLRYLLKTSSGWLADHSLVDDSSGLITHRKGNAMVFTDFDAACRCGRSLLELFPDLFVQAVQQDSCHAKPERRGVPSAHVN